jgi:hypothetical protein
MRNDAALDIHNILAQAESNSDCDGDRGEHFVNLCPVKLVMVQFSLSLDGIYLLAGSRRHD